VGTEAAARENPNPENPGQYTQIGFLKAGDGVLSVLSRVSPQEKADLIAFLNSL